MGASLLALAKSIYYMYSLSIFSLAEILQLILEISVTYRLVSYQLAADNWLPVICRLRAQCMIPRAMSNRFRVTVYLSLSISKQCIIKQLSYLVSVISGIIKVSPRPSVRLITLTSTLIILDITKTSSNNCLLLP